MQQTIITAQQHYSALDAWLEGFHDTEKSVRHTVSAIAGHPLIPADVTVRGFIIDSATGELAEIR